MRILIWSELYWPYLGGAEVAMVELASDLSERGHEFAVITSHDYLDLPDRELHRGAEIYRLAMREALRTADVVRCVTLRREIALLRKRIAADVTLLTGADATALFELQTREACPAPLVLRLNQQLLASHAAGRATLLERALRASDAVVSVSSRVLEQARRLVPEIEDRSSVIATAQREPTTAPGPLPEDPPVLLFLGRLVPDKGVDLLLEAVAKLPPELADVSLLVAGDGAERERLEQRARFLGLGERVRFLGWVEPAEVPDLMNRASLVALPSRREGLPSVAIQAAWMGRPVVCTDAGGLPEIVVDGETGLRVPVEDPSALAAGLERLLVDPTESRRMARAARERAQARFSWSRYVDAYESLLLEVRR